MQRLGWIPPEEHMDRIKTTVLCKDMYNLCDIPIDKYQQQKTKTKKHKKQQS